MKKTILSLMLILSMFALSSCEAMNKIKYDILSETNPGILFQIALENRNVELLNEIVSEYPEYDINECEQGSSLAKALFNNGGRPTDWVNTNFARALLDAGANPNAKSSTGDYLMITACDNNYYWAVDMLVEYGADVNVLNELGKSPLYYVMANSNLDSEEHRIKTAELLVENGADVSSELFEYDENLSEDYAYIHFENSPIVSHYLMQILHDSGEYTNLPLSLEYAISGDVDKTIDSIRNGEELTDKQKSLVCEYVSYFGTPEELELVWSLLSVKRYGEFKRIIQCGNYDMVVFLTESHNVPVLSEDVIPSQKEYLKCAVLFGHDDIFEYLCANGAYVPSTELLLNAALVSQDFEMFKNVYDFYENNSIEVSEEIDIAWLDAMILNENIQYVEYLMKEKKHTFKYYTFENIDYSTAVFMYENGRPLNITDLDYAIIHNDINYIELVLNHGADINQKCYLIEYSHLLNEYPEDVLHYDEFIKNHIYYENIDLDNKKLPSSLSYLIGRCNSECVEYLVNNGAVLENDVLIYAYESSALTVQFLLDAGASTNVEIPEQYKGGFLPENKEYSLKDVYEQEGRYDLIDLL